MDFTAVPLSTRPEIILHLNKNRGRSQVGAVPKVLLLLPVSSVTFLCVNTAMRTMKRTEFGTHREQLCAGRRINVLGG